MKRNAVDWWVGLFVLLGFAAIIFLAVRAGNMSGASFGGQSYETRALFDNIGGLKPRAAVRSAGVVVGRVTAIRFDDKAYQAAVTMTLDSRYQFPKDSSAKILTAGLLGEQYIGLEPGGDDKMLAEGDTIRQTQSAVVLENLIGQFLYGKAAQSGDTNNSGGAAPAPAGNGGAAGSAGGAAGSAGGAAGSAGTAGSAPGSAGGATPAAPNAPAAPAGEQGSKK